jgi:hypothetical protein
MILPGLSWTTCIVSGMLAAETLTICYYVWKGRARKRSRGQVVISLAAARQKRTGRSGNGNHRTLRQRRKA